MIASKKNKPRTILNIGMPVYNGEEYIRDALDSLITQTFTNFELTISDNASTDNTEKICQEYVLKDKRIKYIKQPENIGAMANFDFVLKEAKSDFFMWAAHDDKWRDTFLERGLLLLQDKSIDFVFPTFMLKSIKLGVYKVFDKDIFSFVESNNRKARVLNFLNLHHDSHKCNIVYSIFNTNFLREALKKQDIGNDGALGTVIVSAGKGKLLDEALFQKRYPYFWPNTLSSLYKRIKRKSKSFELAKKSALNTLKKLFPEYVSEIEVVFNSYYSYTYHDKYQIINYKELIDSKNKEKHFQ